MIDNVAIDVVIGIVFVYLLYSLYATIIMEMIGSFLGLRARNLLYALRRMLMDEKEYNAFVRRIFRFVNSVISMSGYATNLEKDEVFKKFLNQPGIQSLKSGGTNNFPSYLEPDTFTKAIIDSIKTEDPDYSEAAKILDGLSKLKDSTLKKHLTSLMNDANNDMVKFRVLVEEWFTTTMDRASGWYKRSVQVILLIIGAIMVIVFNVDSLAIIKKLSTNKEAREQWVKIAVDYNQRHQGESTPAAPADTSAKDPETKDKEKSFEELKKMKGELDENIAESQSILSAGWNLSPILHYYKKDAAPPKPPADSVFVDHLLNSKDKVVVVVHESVDQALLKSLLPGCLNKEGMLETPMLSYKVVHVWRNFAGYFLSVLAISLGSPFWFDLLNKLVRLKTSKGVAEPEVKDAAKASDSNRDIKKRIG